MGLSACSCAPLGVDLVLSGGACCGQNRRALLQRHTPGAWACIELLQVERALDPSNMHPVTRASSPTTHRSRPIDGIAWNRSEKVSKYSKWKPSNDSNFSKHLNGMMQTIRTEMLSDFARVLGEVKLPTAKKHDDEEEEALRRIRLELKQFRRLRNETRDLDHRKHMSRILWKYCNTVKQSGNTSSTRTIWRRGDGAVGTQIIATKRRAFSLARYIQRCRRSTSSSMRLERPLRTMVGEVLEEQGRGRPIATPDLASLH